MPLQKKRPPSRFNRKALNPAFAAAHGIPNADPTKDRDSSLNNKSDSKDDNDSPTTGSSTKRFSLAIKAARSTGKLNLSNMGLSKDLPSSIFDLRSEVKYDYSMNRSENSWDCHGEETLTLVDFSDNELGELDPRIECYVSLQTLRARRCQLNSLRTDIVSKLENLAVLDLSSNSIDGVVRLDSFPSTLTELNLSGNAIESLESSGNIIHMPYLRILDMSKNKLTSLPPQMDAKQLQNLIISQNNIESIPSTLFHDASSITTLIASDNKMSIPPDLSPCKMLRIVDLSKNELLNAPTVHDSLERLILNENKISSLSGMLSGTAKASLIELHVSDNRLNELSHDFVKSLLELSVLDITNNDLKDLPYELGYLPALRRVRLEGNALRRGRDTHDMATWKKSLRKRGPRPDGEGYIEEEPGSVPTKSKVGKGKGGGNSLSKQVEGKAGVVSLTQGKSLNLANKQLVSFSDAILEELASGIGHSVLSFNLKQNSLESIPEELIQAMPNMTSLDISVNQLQSLPSNLQNLPLTTLLLERNKLSSQSFCTIPITPTHSCYNKLTDLNLSSNKLTTLPNNILPLPSLSTLIISYNNLTSLENWKPHSLPSLNRFDASNNKLSTLHTLPIIWAGCNPKLRILQLQNNNMSKIPCELGLLHEMQCLDLRGNPQRAIRLSVLDKSCHDILKYLKMRLDVGELARATGEIDRFKGEVGLSVGGETVTTNSDGKEGINDESDGLDELREEIDKMSVELKNTHLSQAKKYAMKKALAMKKATLIKEERKLKLRK